MTTRVTVLLPTYNNAALLRGCMESAGWADEILVVDSFSSDGTPELARELGARVIQHEYLNSALQKNWAIPQCGSEWVLQLDSDERMPPDAAGAIRQAVAEAPADLHAYRLPRRNEVLGVWCQVENLYPDYQTRLFRRDQGRFEDKEVHAHVRVPGRVATLAVPILHFGMPHIGKQLTNLDRYTRYGADELRKRGKRFHWYQLALRPFALFAYYYMWKRGFTAGYRGLLVAMLNVTFDFWTHAKLWELETLRLPSSPR